MHEEMIEQIKLHGIEGAYTGEVNDQGQVHGEGYF